jgi:hypothetical protein
LNIVEIGHYPINMSIQIPSLKIYGVSTQMRGERYNWSGIEVYNWYESVLCSSSFLREPLVLVLTYILYSQVLCGSFFLTEPGVSVLTL